MVQLETVEDFEKVKKALDNPNSPESQYRIASIGYCTACKTLTMYEGHYGPEVCSETCLRCMRVFEQGSESVNHRMHYQGYYFYYSDAEFIPDEFRKRFEELRSRAFQKKAFNSELDKYIKKEKAKVRKHKSNLHRAAKLKAK